MRVTGRPLAVASLNVSIRGAEIVNQTGAKQMDHGTLIFAAITLPFVAFVVAFVATQAILFGAQKEQDK